MIIIPSFYGVFMLLFIPTWLITLKIKWNRVNRLPMERKWIFTKEGVTIDKTYSKSLHLWITIQNVTITKRAIFFGTTKPKMFGISLGFGDSHLDLLKKNNLRNY